MTYRFRENRHGKPHRVGQTHGSAHDDRLGYRCITVYRTRSALISLKTG